MHPVVILPPPQIATGDVNSAFALDSPNYLRHGVLGWD